MPDYPSGYFTAPSTSFDKKSGVVAQHENGWGTYSIYQRNGKVWIEAIGHGGAIRPQPAVETLEEALLVVWKNSKPADKSDIISF